MIELINVTKKYGSFIAVDDINFSIEEGEIVGLLGPNGAGKTTTMNMITGFIEATDGSITINGLDIIKNARKAKKEIGYMPENVPLYMDLTVREFITYMAELRMTPRKGRKEDVSNIIKQTKISDVSNKLIKNLSRGYRQRVSLAGALIGNPKVLILDEPTVGLDPKQVTEIRSLIKSLGKDHTVIISSHILSEISQMCKKVIIIDKGKIVAIDSPENLEQKVKRDNSILITIEDQEDKVESILMKIPDVKEIKLMEANSDSTKQYYVSAKGDSDLRKIIFEVLAKEKITIFELKRTETTLEDAFIKLIGKEEKGEDD